MNTPSMSNTQRTDSARELPLSEIQFSIPESKIAELKTKAPHKPIVGQSRAVSALELGLGIHGEGYNIFIMGAPGTGRRTVLSSLLKDYKPNKAELQDIAYVYNYRHPYEPAALFFPAGEGKKFQQAVKTAVENVYTQAQQLEKSEGFLSAQKKILSAADGEENSRLADFETKMLTRGFKLLQLKEEGNQSIDLVPLIKGKEVSFAELQSQVSRKKFPETELNALREVYYSSLDEMTDLFALLRRNRKESEEKLKQLYLDLLQPVIGKEFELLYSIVNSYPAGTEGQKSACEKITYFLKKTEADLLSRAFLYAEPFKSPRHKKTFFGRYAVNLICENPDDKSYIVDETLPSFSNLFGTIEGHGDGEGAMVNGHLHIRGGSVHRALGGFLVLRLKDLLEEDDSWVYLKRVLQSGSIAVQPPPAGTHNPSLYKPEPIPARLKVIIIGGEYTYEILYQEDPDFYKLFKVCAEFDSVMPHTDENLAAVLSLIETFVKNQHSMPFTDAGYAKLLAYTVEMSGCRHLISAQFTKISDFVAEANYVASRHGNSVITDDIVQKTIEQRHYLAALPEEKFAEMVALKEILIDTFGTAVGKVNGLAVEERGFHTFGIPVSVTAQASPGTAGIINIEREAGLSGEIYDKAHLIISSLLRQKYAPNFPLSVSAAICFEQSYGIIDGDSASCAELFALLSAIGKIPLRQDIAVTGSVNQLGMVQPVGGISEKITGFFDTCAIRGFTGTQGVLIPQSNKNNLFLPDRVLKAVAEKRFRIWAIGHIDEGIEILSGMDRGALNVCVSSVLKDFAEKVKSFQK
ncbi:MAG: ATP-binding protein [Treponema sp.]